MRIFVATCAFLLTLSGHAATLQDSLNTVSATNQQAADSNKRISDLAQQSRALLEEYRQLQHVATPEPQQIKALQDTRANQEHEIAQLRQRITSARQAQLQIAPMMIKMADALDQFIQLDLPFHQEERRNRVQEIKALVGNTDVGLSERYRRLMDAWQIELDYGRSIESWRGTLLNDPKSRSVNYLRVGRLALYYQTLDGKESGMWDSATQNWYALPASYNANLKDSMKSSQNLSAPTLLSVPMNPEVGKQP